MAAEQYMIFGISIVLCVCLTINSIILIRDLFICEPSVGFLDVVFIVMRAITIVIMWRIWAIITFEIIPWDKPSDNSVDKVEQVDTVEQKQEQNLEINLPT